MRVKDIVILRNEKTSDTSMPYIALENIQSWDAKFIPSDAETEGTNNIFHRGDILFGKLRPYLAKGFIPDYDGICSTEFFVLKPRNGFNRYYLLYLFLSDPFINFIKAQVAGVKMPRANWASFGNMHISVPSLEEQNKVVSYLDTKIKSVDSRISILDKQLKLYDRLKRSIIYNAVTRGINSSVSFQDSGIDWIGQIPAQWEIKRFKDIFKKYTTGFTPPSKDERNFSDDSSKTWITIADLSSKFVSDSSLYLSQKAIEDNDAIIVKKGALLFSFKLSIGKVAFAGKDLYTNEAIVSIPPRERYSLSYFYYLIPLICLNNATENIYGAKMLNQKIIANMLLSVPPLSEQYAIAQYLDEKCAKIDAAMDNITKQIDLSKRLKRAIINEALNGKFN